MEDDIWFLNTETQNPISAVVFDNLRHFTENSIKTFCEITIPINLSLDSVEKTCQFCVNIVYPVKENLDGIIS